MFANPSCPKNEVLAELMKGMLSHPAAEPLNQHLEECENCSKVVATLPPEDTLIEAARAPSSVSESEAAGDAARPRYNAPQTPWSRPLKLSREWKNPEMQST